MSQIITDITTGSLKITDKWEISATGSQGPPEFNHPNDQFVYSFVDIESVDKLKTFSMTFSGSTEDRYLEAEYRISRDTMNWTSWLPLNRSITNFPPFSSKWKMSLDIKFTRRGESQTGKIKLLEYVINGSLDRQIYDGESVVNLSDDNNLSIIKPPYIYKVFKLTDIEIISDGQIDLNFTIKWRWSQDYGRTVTNWEPFTKENVTSARVSPIRFFQVEYLIEQLSGNARIWDINLIGDFQNISLDYLKTNFYGIRENCNCIKLGITGDPSTFPGLTNGVSSIDSPIENCNLPQLNNEDKLNLFKPYQQQAAVDLLDKMSNDSNEIFGHEIVYFLTDPDKKGIDYTFHEYQLYNYVADGTIKVSVEGNQFPDNTGAINQFDLSLFDSFEIHIPKRLFKDVFGVDKRPSKEDFILFCEINRMFIVEHSQPYRGFNNNVIYYKTMLKKYNQRSNVVGMNDVLEDKLKSLTRNSTIDELFGVENIEDKKSTANKDQQSPLTFDPIRFDISAKIVREIVQNAEVIISSDHYDLSSVNFTATQSSPAVTYKGIKDYFNKGENLSFTCWFNINNWTINDIYRLINYYDTTNSLGIDISISNNNVRVKWCDDEYNMNLEDGLIEGTWYAYVVNINQRIGKIDQWVYKRDVDNEEDAEYLTKTKLRKVYSVSEDLVPRSFKLQGVNVNLLSCDMKLTNLRLFSDIIPEETHTKLLNQYIIRNDSKYLILADNANRKITLPNFPLSQLPPGEIV